MTLKICYNLVTKDHNELTYTLEYNGERYQLTEPIENPPPWTELRYKQCSHCPYKEGEGPLHCPVAKSIAPVIPDMDSLISSENINLKVITSDKIISQETTVQQALGALLGLLIANSGCPHTEFLLPLARFHLPLAGAQETLWRASGSFLLAQFFRAQEGKPVESLENLLLRYENLGTLNQYMVKRLNSQVTEDTSLNAIDLLDSYAKQIPYFLRKSIYDLKPLYNSYLID